MQATAILCSSSPQLARDQTLQVRRCVHSGPAVQFDLRSCRASPFDPRLRHLRAPQSWRRHSDDRHLTSLSTSISLWPMGAALSLTYLRAQTTLTKLAKNSVRWDTGSQRGRGHQGESKLLAQVHTHRRCFGWRGGRSGACEHSVSRRKLRGFHISGLHSRQARARSGPDSCVRWGH